MTNKTFKCPKCGGSEWIENDDYHVDGKPVRGCGSGACRFAWSHLNDHLYLKESEPEIVRYAIRTDSCGLFVFGAGTYIDMAVRSPGFSGFEFEDGSVSLGSPWAWKGERTGRIYHGTRSQEELADYTPVLAKFVRIKEAS